MERISIKNKENYKLQVCENFFQGLLLPVLLLKYAKIGGKAGSQNFTCPQNESKQFLLFIYIER